MKKWVAKTIKNHPVPRCAFFVFKGLHQPLQDCASAIKLTTIISAKAALASHGADHPKINNRIRNGSVLIPDKVSLCASAHNLNTAHTHRAYPNKRHRNTDHNNGTDSPYQRPLWDRCRGQHSSSFLRVFGLSSVFHPIYDLLSLDYKRELGSTDKEVILEMLMKQKCL